MNERYKTLWFEAAELESDPSWEGQTKFMEKFAELIVKECINKIETHQIPVGNSAAGEIACEMTYTALKQIRDEIKEEFGVEELPVCKHDWYSAKNPVVQNGSVCVICGAIDAREPEELKNERH